MATDLLARAQAGDDGAFRRLTDPHRRELHVHCYRMLGSFQDAEDALQDTLLAAWQGLAAFEGRSSVRTWLYRIATNRCLNARRAASRRPQPWANPAVVPPEPTCRWELSWLEPYPDALLAEGPGAPPGPEARYEQRESMSLAFVAALQRLPARQRAVLILRDVLGYRAEEVAELLDATLDSVNSALKRARATLERQHGLTRERAAPGSPSERELVAKLVRAYEVCDMDALIALLTDDVRLTMPPIDLEYHGRDAVAGFMHAIGRLGRQFEIVTTRANGDPMLVTYQRVADGEPRPATGLVVFTIGPDGVVAFSHFDRGLLPSFGLPLVLDPGEGTT